MISQLRIYTINRGMMPAWLECYKNELLPMMKAHGMRIDAAWATSAGTEFIWVRTYNDNEDLAAIEASFYGSPEWLAAREHVASYIAKTEVRLMQPLEGA